MASRAEFEPVLPFAGFLYIENDILLNAIELLQRVIPKLECSSPAIPFNYSDYYNKELGGCPSRIWIASSETADPSLLADWKIASNEIEAKLATSEGRRINIDPGFIGLSKVVLASCKDHPQRVPLRGGIYAEIELIFRLEGWKNTDWTYRDYADAPAKQFLFEQREYLLTLIRDRR